MISDAFYYCKPPSRQIKAERLYFLSAGKEFFQGYCFQSRL